MYKPKAGDRVEFVGGQGYTGILRPGDKGTVTAGPLRPFVVWDDGRRSIPLWSLCRLLGEEARMPRVGDWVELVCDHVDSSLQAGDRGAVCRTDDDRADVLWNDGIRRWVKRGPGSLRIFLPVLGAGEEELSPMRRWESACRDFHMADDDTDNLNDRARVLHWRHGELFPPPEAPKIKGAVCPKCGHGRVRIRHSGDYGGGEWLACRCSRCDYGWKEECLDAE